MRKSLSNSKLLSVGESCRETDSEQWVSNNTAFSQRKGHSAFIWKMIARVSITSILTTIITVSMQIQKPIIRPFCKSSSLESLWANCKPFYSFSLFYVWQNKLHETVYTVHLTKEDFHFFRLFRPNFLCPCCLAALKVTNVFEITTNSNSVV